jgi:hypothetical protein
MKRNFVPKLSEPKNYFAFFNDLLHRIQQANANHTTNPNDLHHIALEFEQRNGGSHSNDRRR